MNPRKRGDPELSRSTSEPLRGAAPARGGEPGSADVLDREPHTPEEEPPPLLGSWPRLYALVIGWLAVTIALLLLLTRSYR